MNPLFPLLMLLLVLCLLVVSVYKLGGGITSLERRVTALEKNIAVMTDTDNHHTRALEHITDSLNILREEAQ